MGLLERLGLNEVFLETFTRWVALMDTFYSLIVD
jgi:hypothetical protein